jgi:guanosine-3',5'-bis(diphosphate) 3'-pyrophosphohydrolase
MSVDFDSRFEEALRFLATNMPHARELIKPTLLHSVRVGMSLYEKGYPVEVSIAGLLHDLLEDSPVGEEDLRREFGENVTILVVANSKDMTIEGKKERNRDLMNRCATESSEAAIIKAADILDNIAYYRKIENADELQGMIRRGRLLLELKRADFEDDIFITLEKEVAISHDPERPSSLE